MEPDEARTGRGIETRANSAHGCGMHPYLRLHKGYTPRSFLLIHCTMHSATMRVHRESAKRQRRRARTFYDQAGVITRKHKLTICPGVLVSLATSRVRCNNWYTLSSATPPTTNQPSPPPTHPSSPPYDQSALAHHPLSTLDDVAPQPSLSKFDVSAYSAMEKSIESENSMK